ncbi:hypothetical protein GQ53DRAFT_816784 [Thozetella sp. PMI_491]|nr:hypothetical protein GQ53DRAFT_816784 [Thozetella sp. PMI_491]
MSRIDEATATIEFLNHAAHLLAKTAPETSAYLMSSSHELMFAKEMPQSDLHRQHACGCCGHVLVPGQGSTLEIEARRPARSKSSQSTSKQRAKESGSPGPTRGASKVFTCGNCGRFTRVPLPPPATMSRKKTASKPPAPAALATATERTTVPPRSVGANASSKKRAKSRKAGLQALLAQSSAHQSPGLTLADFMK